ncbi:hypothetical protein FJ872_05330 [Mesorhizobium sp. B2-5-9]|uniref:hypothetical protein n=1 Tax=unclassified Mesorhizobium TaxID=325217 RepID=UPI0011266660|nr:MULTISPECIES: hypothetical protein [unclassified Mesorhizobium]MBZ9908231.1 hypothetical protein [Mesorhizobium sp. BR115XR7A]MBZ9930540.1 hypothetical protein [Mesorhizobium sp. BR1-1-5]TPK23069.1 hypothetical protein FJ872_05330 [Mesorhizobium sp. B2-5-9]
MKTIRNPSGKCHFDIFRAANKIISLLRRCAAQYAKLHRSLGKSSKKLARSTLPSESQRFFGLRFDGVFLRPPAPVYTDRDKL